MARRKPGSGKGTTGFAALSTLTSRVEGGGNAKASEPETRKVGEATPSKSVASKSGTSQTGANSAHSGVPNSTVASEKHSSSTPKAPPGKEMSLETKLVLLLLAAIGVIWLLSLNGASPPPRSSSTPTRTQPVTTPVQNVPATGVTGDQALDFQRPPMGTNHILSVAQIRWCVREDIFLEALRPLTTTNAELGIFNTRVDDYNARCGSYRYRTGVRERATREVERQRQQIEAEARRLFAAPVQTTRKAAMRSPTPGPVQTDQWVRFSWSAGTGVSEYRLSGGTRGHGSNDLFGPFPTTATAREEFIPRMSGRLYVRLSSLIGGTWQHEDYTYSAVPPAAPVTSNGGNRSQSVETTHSAQRRAAFNFVSSVIGSHARDDSTALASVSNSYAATVNYFGTVTRRADIVEDKRSYFRRWPERSYRIRPESVNVTCTDLRCDVKGVYEWSVRSVPRNSQASGTASFEFRVDMSGSDMRILYETSEVLSRNRPN